MLNWDPGVNNGTSVDHTERDPRVNPVVGDVIRKWGQNFTVSFVQQGLVRLVFPEWTVGILFYRRWASDAEVMHIDRCLTNLRRYA